MLRILYTRMIPIPIAPLSFETRRFHLMIWFCPILGLFTKQYPLQDLFMLLTDRPPFVTITFWFLSEKLWQTIICFWSVLVGISTDSSEGISLAVIGLKSIIRCFKLRTSSSRETLGSLRYISTMVSFFIFISSSSSMNWSSNFTNWLFSLDSYSARLIMSQASASWPSHKPTWTHSWQRRRSCLKQSRN